MKLAFRSLFFIVLFNLFFSTNADATHVVGADISYRCLGDNEYEFTLNVYRDCDGIPVSPFFKMDYSSLSCNIQGNFDVRQVGAP
ncbi:MAG: hypothetical protein ACK4ND_01345, partial [Cytophagaceae bacterium]